MKKEKGITLVALIVTIIIMLILAGVTITAVVGEGGLMERANRAIQEHEKGEEKEILGLSYAGRYIEYELYDKEITPEEMKEEIKNNGEEARAMLDQENQKNMYITFQKTGNVYSLNIETGEIKHIGKYTGEHDKEDLTESDIIFSSTPTKITKENVTTSIKVKQEIEMKDYKLEWTRTPLDRNSWQEYKEKITSEKNEVIYARIKDTLTGQTKLQTSIAIKNIDKQEPSGTLEVTEQTTNKVTLQVEANDPETDDYASSGIKGYYYSKDNGTTWSDITTAVRYRFTGLTQGAEYKFKVKIEDNAGNTKEVGTSGNTGLITGIITFGTPQWSTSTANSATVAISASQSGCELKYTIGNTTDIANWTTISSGTEITVSSGTTIKAALWDGTNAGTTGTKTVRDETAPSIDLKANTTAWAQSVTLTGTATDNESLVTHWDWAQTVTTARTATRATGNQTKTITANGRYYFAAKNGVGATAYASIDVSNIDTEKPTITIGSSTTNSVSFTGKDNVGIVGYAVTETNSTPSSWTSITSTTSLETTKISGLTHGKTYYVHVKDAAGNTVYTSKTLGTVTTPTSSDLRYTTSWSGTNATATFTTTSGFNIQTSTDGSNWGGNPITVASGTQIYARYTDTTNNSTKYAAVKPLWTGTVTYNANGGSGGPSIQNVQHTTTVTVNFSSNPTRTGYTFKGWSTSSNATSATYTSSGTKTFTMGTSNVTLYAVWKANTYTITYNANGGSGAPASQSYTYHPTEVTYLSSTIPTRMGYRFLGWSLSSTATNGSYNAGQYWCRFNADNYTLYAVWQANTYKIYFSANGGSGAPSAITRTYGQSVTFPSTKPTKTGYMFQGWLYYGTGNSSSTATSTATNASYSAGATAQPASGNICYIANDTTYVAIWTVNTYTLTINANGGTMTSGSTGGNISSYTTKFKYNQVTGFRKGLGGGKNQYAEPVRSGYKFIGWEFSNGTGSTSATDKKSDIYCYAEESGTFWQASESTYYFNGNYAGNVTAKAKWKANTYNLTINPNGGTFTKPGGTALSGNFSTTFTYGSGDQLFCETGYYTSNSSAKWLGAVPYEVSNGCALPKREGYTFNGWKVSGGSISIGDFKGSNGYTCYNYHYKCDYAGNVTITAQWTAKTYTLTIDPAGGSYYLSSSVGWTTSVRTRPFTYGELTPISNTGNTYTEGDTPTAPRKTGYTFAGWKVTKGTGTITIPDGWYRYDGKCAGNVTITAQWTAN